MKRIGTLFFVFSIGFCVISCQTLATNQEPTQTEYIYKTVAGKTLSLYVHFPPGWQATDQRPVIVFFFGGGWRSGTVKQFEFQANYFATRGMVACRADYRVKSRDQVTPDKCVEDARSAVRWIRKNAGRLGVNPNKLVASGGSAGGHLAACTMIQDCVDDPHDDLSISPLPQAMVLYNPVLNVTGSDIMKRFGFEKETAYQISPTLHINKNTPPSIIMFGTEDRLKALGDEYWAKAKQLGIRADAFIAEGQDHAFFNRSPWLERTTIAADRFLASLGYIQGDPTLRISEEKNNNQDP